MTLKKLLKMFVSALSGLLMLILFYFAMTEVNLGLAMNTRIPREVFYKAATVCLVVKFSALIGIALLLGLNQYMWTGKFYWPTPQDS